MEDRDEVADEAFSALAERTPLREATNGPEWKRELRSSVRAAGGLITLLLVVDAGSGGITPWRAALWWALGGLLCVVLWPARISAGETWLASRELLREHRVRTDLLVSVRCVDGVAQRLVLRDSLGGRVEIDARVLVRHPGLWCLLDDGARKATANGLLQHGAPALERIAQRVADENARAVFKASGVE
ncbi:hypothetical protein [Streptomyces sp. NPDC056600]|uniref:hypothetical protein n=1 Tax=Streptomyces sp. NPDC056600 TaxID=3345874 RepID=UPI0036C9C7E6